MDWRSCCVLTHAHVFRGPLDDFGHTLMRHSGSIAARTLYTNATLLRRIAFCRLRRSGHANIARQAKARSRKRSADAPCGPEEDAGMKLNGAQGLAQVVFPVNDVSKAGSKQQERIHLSEGRVRGADVGRLFWTTDKVPIRSRCPDRRRCFRRSQGRGRRPERGRTRRGNGSFGSDNRPSKNGQG